ncbi:MAG: transcription elongation factor GreA [Deltaproteobacteria bacterium]|nr:transcription elongation factor GreA [Deltaproteobacteria bacterium]
MSERVPMTPEGYRMLQDELKRCKTVERPRIIEAIEEARSHGDLTENAEYDAAKEAQQQLDRRMQDIEDKLARAQVIRMEDIQLDKVVFGVTVALTDLEHDRQVTYKLVGEDEADLAAGKLSVHSPLARAMIGKQAGDFVCFRSPAGEREYVIEEIRKE